jgi:carboxymethylenebutenolidase
MVGKWLVAGGVACAVAVVGVIVLRPGAEARSTAAPSDDPRLAAPSPSSPPSLPRPDVDAAAGTFAVKLRSGSYGLHGDVLKPEGTGPFPAIVYNHGSEQDPGLDTFESIGQFFQAHGWVAFFPYRRGTTGSEGPYWQDEVRKRPEAERHEAVVAELERENDDVLAAIDWIAAQPYVDPRRVAVAGCSFGGIHTVLAAERAQGIFAAVDFAGASMSWAESPPLQERLRRAARAARVPVFFLQAENDFDTTPSRALSDEMLIAGKPTRVKIFPPHGKTHMAGHAGFCTHGMGEWGDDVLAFLRESAR